MYSKIRITGLMCPTFSFFLSSFCEINFVNYLDTKLASLFFPVSSIAGCPKRVAFLEYATRLFIFPGNIFEHSAKFCKYPVQTKLLALFSVYIRMNLNEMSY